MRGVKIVRISNSPLKPLMEIHVTQPNATFFVFTIPDICQFWYTTGLHQECKKSLQKKHISPRRVQRLEKNATPLVLAVLTNISYGVHIV